MRRETVPGGQAIWQSDTAKTYQCPVCHGYVFTQYEGEASPTKIACVLSADNLGVRSHVVEWDESKQFQQVDGTESTLYLHGSGWVPE